MPARQNWTGSQHPPQTAGTRRTRLSKQRTPPPNSSAPGAWMTRSQRPAAAGGLALGPAPDVCGSGVSLVAAAGGFAVGGFPPGGMMIDGRSRLVHLLDLANGNMLCLNAASQNRLVITRRVATVICYFE